ncbi:MAG: tetratricopeptide repeat protein [Myxococcales bacterium]
MSHLFLSIFALSVVSAAPAPATMPEPPEQTRLRHEREDAEIRLKELAATASAPKLFDEGMNRFAERRYAEAALFLEEALKVDPTHAKAHVHLATCYMKADRTEEAVPHFREFLRLAPADPMASKVAAILKAYDAKAKDAGKAAPEAKPAARPPKTWRSKTGYQQTRWGMTPKQVKALYPGALENGAMVVAKGKAAGHDAQIGFLFLDGSLAGVALIFQDGVFAAERLKVFEDVKKGLIVKYGEPADDSENWRQPAMRGTVDKATAIGLGALELSTKWVGDGETAIHLGCSAKDAVLSVQLQYFSIAFFDELERYVGGGQTDGL